MPAHMGANWEQEADEMQSASVHPRVLSTVVDDKRRGGTGGVGEVNDTSLVSGRDDRRFRPLRTPDFRQHEDRQVDVGKGGEGVHPRRTDTKDSANSFPTD